VRGLTLILLLTTAAAAQEGDVDLAKAHYKTGQIYYAAGRYNEAAHEFEESYRLAKRPELLFNMGKAYDGLGDHARALTSYRRFMLRVPDSPDFAEVHRRISALEGLVGRLRIDASVDGALVTVDNQAIGHTPLHEIVELNPGSHAIAVSKEGFRTWRSTVTAAPGAEQSRLVQLESLVQVIEVERKVPIHKRWWLWTIVGVVVAGGVVAGAVLGSRVPPVEGDFAQYPDVR
jgi:tetratricopeptide (TPR) repeat protein